MPVVFARRSAVNSIVNTALGEDLASLEAKIDKGPTPHSRELTGWSALCQTNVIRRSQDVKNVAAVLEGRGALADQTIVVGAHYDHLGRGRSGSGSPSTNEIRNGADDNASGTAGVLEIARAMASRTDVAARRRIVFVAFAAEERGLLGSREYVQRPPFPLDRTVAMVNLDMIGRLTNNKLTVYGTGTSKEFETLIDELNQKYAFDLKKESPGRGASDHASFYEKKIPVLHFFTGVHGDLHLPSDDFDKINLDGMTRITQMVIDVVERLACSEQPPQYLATQSPAPRGRGEKPKVMP